MSDKHSLQDKLIVALGLALDEIHHPGAAAAAGVDIDAICRGVLKKAAKTGGVPMMIREEILRRAASAAT